MPESKAHKKLKLLAEKWLLNHGCEYVVFEYAFFDVAGFKNDRMIMAVECGNLSYKPYSQCNMPIYHLPFGVYGMKHIDNAIRRLKTKCQ